MFIGRERRSHPAYSNKREEDIEQADRHTDSGNTVHHLRAALFAQISRDREILSIC